MIKPSSPSLLPPFRRKINKDGRVCVQGRSKLRAHAYKYPPPFREDSWITIGGIHRPTVVHAQRASGKQILLACSWLIPKFRIPQIPPQGDVTGSRPDRYRWQFKLWLFHAMDDDTSIIWRGRDPWMDPSVLSLFIYFKRSKRLDLTIYDI